MNARLQREERLQRLVIIATASAIGLALLAVIGGVVYDRLWVPSRPVAQVGDVSLSRSDYWVERRNAYAREIVQNFQLLALFGGNPQFTQQFQGQSPNIDNQIEVIRSAEVDGNVVGQWETRQIKEQGAQGLEISVSQDEINQALVNDLSLVFLPPPASPVTDTAELAPTVDPAATSDPAVTPTPAPTSTVAPTPAPAEAATQADQIIDEIFRRYEIELAAAAEEPDLTKADFRAALDDQYREQAINTRVQAQLVPEEGFVFSTEPERVQARQVLVAVTPPAGATQEQIDAAFAEARPRADTLAADLRGGADFATVAAESSDDPGSSAQGGDLGFFDTNGAAESGVTYPSEVVEQAFALEEGVISDPIRTQFGWHIIEVTGRDVPPEDQQLREARTEALDTWVEEQRAQIAVARFPEPTPTTPAEPTTEAPTAVPVFAPGPPTAEPTPTVTPEVAPTAAPAAPTPTP